MPSCIRIAEQRITWARVVGGSGRSGAWSGGRRMVDGARALLAAPCSLSSSPDSLAAGPDLRRSDDFTGLGRSAARSACAPPSRGGAAGPRRGAPSWPRSGGPGGSAASPWVEGCWPLSAQHPPPSPSLPLPRPAVPSSFSSATRRCAPPISAALLLEFARPSQCGLDPDGPGPYAASGCCALQGSGSRKLGPLAGFRCPKAKLPQVPELFRRQLNSFQ